MRSFFTGFLIMSMLGMRAGAECVYFRVSAKLLTCGPADEKALKASDPYPAAPELPDLQEPAKQTLVQVTCTCDYSLQGSDPRCDTDQTQEKSSVFGAEDPDHSCRRGNTLCRDVCPSRLP